MKYNLPDHLSGDTYNAVQFQLVLDDGNDTPIDITDATFKCSIRKDPTKAAVLSWTSPSNIVIVDASLGKFKLDLGVVTVTDEYEYFYDIEMTDADGIVKTYISGKWKINLDISR